jgi:pentatricopeptide repeat protein
MSITKKQLQERYDLSDNTVYKTLKACGLDTAKTAYTEEEIEERFVKARGILDGGGTYQEVENFFSIKEASADFGEDFEDITPDAASITSLRREMSKEVLKTYDQVMDAAVRDIIPYLPLLLNKAGNRYAREGEISKAFQLYRDMNTREESLTFDVSAMAGPGSSSAAGGLSGDVDEAWLSEYQEFDEFDEDDDEDINANDDPEDDGLDEIEPERA